MKRNEKGQFSTEQKKDFRIRVTKEEKEMIENERQKKEIVTEIMNNLEGLAFNSDEGLIIWLNEKLDDFALTNDMKKNIFQEVIISEVVCSNCEAECNKLIVNQVTKTFSCCACDLAQKDYACEKCQDRV